jgi:hypothetical protein
MNSCTQKGEDSIYILPQDYVGYVVVLYNQADGEQKQYEGNKRIYKIPSSGILKTQFSPDYGITQFPEFYYSNIIETNLIPVIVDWKDLKEDKTNATLPSIGKAYKKLDRTEAIEYAVFFIGTKSQIKEYSDSLNKINIISLATQECTLFEDSSINIRNFENRRK